MNISNKPLTCAEVKSRDMVDYLASLGFEPKRISRQHYWYISPFRNERTASFKVNRALNKWYDFGEGRGGNLIDFGVLYFKCSVSEFLKQLPLTSLQHQPHILPPERQKLEEGLITILKVEKLSSPVLFHYLKHRKIDSEVAQSFCKEVMFELYKKKYYAIGFKNDANGYELRNQFFKGSSQPKGITTIEGKEQKLVVFEGFFDFLSYLTIYKYSAYLIEDCLILNSLSFLNKAKPLLKNYNQVHLFLDRDTKGQNCTLELLLLGSHIQDESHLYHRNKDLNEWLMNFGIPKNLAPQTNCNNIQQTTENSIGQPD
ncbi:toprim domain-containing protein [Ilyomonas limi]|nr:toprim domain-containing protein [Ilyomonas limi]